MQTETKNTVIECKNMDIVLSEFKNSLVDFFDQMIEEFSEEGDLIRMRIFLKDQVDIKKIIEIFNYNFQKEDQNMIKLIKDKNDKIFIEYDLFNFETEKAKINFKKLWRALQMTEDDHNKNVIWKWLRTFVYLVDKYNKCK